MLGLSKKISRGLSSFSRAAFRTVWLTKAKSKWSASRRTSSVLHIVLTFFTIMLMLDAQKVSLLCAKGVIIMLSKRIDNIA